MAALAARAAAEGAWYNVRINLPGLKDEAFRRSTAAEAGEIRRRVRLRAEAVHKRIEKGLEEV